MKIIVNTKNYTPFEYTPYLEQGSEIKKPADATIEVGQVVVVSRDGNSELAVILGCIDEKVDGTVRLDLCGMTPIEDIRPAVVTDFLRRTVKCCEKLRKECQGFKVNYNWETYELTIEDPKF